MRQALLISTLLAALVGASAPAAAATLIWNVRTTVPQTVHLRFFSQTRNVSWPGPGKSWTLGAQFQEFRLTCRRSELICYGAGTLNESVIWGLGPFGDQPCTDCCLVCGEGKGRTTLGD